jgi:hypothetical protein
MLAPCFYETLFLILNETINFIFPNMEKAKATRSHHGFLFTFPKASLLLPS